MIAGAPCDSAHLLDALSTLGEKNVVVFDENGGAVAVSDSERLRMDPYVEADPPLDLTGAGDAFASTTVAAFVRGLPLREALRWPAVNAWAVSRQFGAQSGLLRYADLEGRLNVASRVFAVRDL